MNVIKTLRINSLYHLSTLNYKHIQNYFNPIHTQLKSLYKNSNSLNQKSLLTINISYSHNHNTFKSQHNIYILYSHNNKLKLSPKHFFIKHIYEFLTWFYNQNNKHQQQITLTKLSKNSLLEGNKSSGD